MSALPIYLSVLLTTLLLFGCDPTHPGPVTPTAVVGSVRYQEDQENLRAELVLSPADTLGELPPPNFLGSGMQRPVAGDAARYLTERTLPFPRPIRFAVPRSDGSRTDLSLEAVPPFIDSLPPTLSKSTGAEIPVLTTPLLAGQSLEIFFEPLSRARPHRIIMNGPFASTRMALTPKALSDIPPGDYSVYLIGQQLDKGDSEGLRYSVQTEYFTRSVGVTVVE